MQLKKLSSFVLLFLAATMILGCPRATGEKGAGGSSANSGPKINPAAGSRDGVPLAKVGPVTLTVEEMTKRINAQSPFVRNRFTDAEKKKEFVTNQIRFEALALEAFDRGFHNDPEVQDSLKKIVVQKLTREEFDSRVKLSDITEAEMKTYFEKNAEEYNKPEMVRSSHIYVPFGSDKAKAKAQIQKAHTAASDKTKMADRAHFKDLVDKYSADESTKRNSGDLRYLSNKELEERFGATAAAAIWELKDLNTVSGVVEGKEGFHVFKKTDHRKAITRTFEQVQNQIRNRLYRDKRMESFNAFVDGLQEKFGTNLDESKLEQVKVQAAPDGAAPKEPENLPHNHP